MFGNVTGWIISAVLVVIALLLGGQLLSASQPSPGSGFVDARFKPLSVEDTVHAVLPPMNDLKDDTGDLYRQASADYERNTIVYDSLKKARDLKEVDYAGLAGLNNLLTAGGCPGMDLFKEKPEEVVGFETNVTVLDNLEALALAAEQVMLLAKVGPKPDYDLSRKYADAVFVLAYHLYKERGAYDELSKAESIFGAVDRVLIDLDRAQKLPDKEAAVKAFDEARLTEYQAKIDPLAKMLHSYGPQALMLYSGDFYQIAADPTIDHVWRVEAVRRIGHLKFDAENKADQLKSPRVLAKMAADPAEDFFVKAAANAAVNMTEKDNQCNR